MARPLDPLPVIDRERVLKLAAEGTTLRRICEIVGVDPQTLVKLTTRDEGFRQQMSVARTAGLELLADDLVDISDTCPDILRARLKSENLRWLLARRIPHQYGDRIAVDMTQQIDLAAALSAANRRIPVTFNGIARDVSQDAQSLALEALIGDAL